MDKKNSRLRRAKKTRAKIAELGVPRLSIHKTPRHTYAQVIDDAQGTVIASVSTTQKEIASQLKYTGNVEAASLVGKLIAEKAVAAGISNVAFDRSGFKYHGRVKSIADAAREAGLVF